MYGMNICILTKILMEPRIHLQKKMGFKKWIWNHINGGQFDLCDQYATKHLFCHYWHKQIYRKTQKKQLIASS
jgi:hypothetical protein